MATISGSGAGQTSSVTEAGARRARVLIVDDHQIIRDGLRLLFVQEQDMDLVGEATDGQEAVTRAGELLPDVVVMDIGLPVMDGIEATSIITRKHPRVKVVGLSMHADPYCISLMTEAGASGYVLKETAFDLLADAIRKVMRGETSFPS